MTVKKYKILWTGLAVILLVAGALTARVMNRGRQVVRLMSDTKAQIRYLVESGETIGEKPAAQTFSVDFLDAIFGDNPDLLKSLKSVISKGLADEPALNLGEVAAMIVTYRKDSEGNVQDVVAHAVGGFSLGKMKPGFHRHGYFFQRIDPNIWNMGNIVIGFLGRDMVLFSEEATAQKQQELLESLFSGEIMPLIETLEKPMFFTAVFPDPRRLMPPQLRNHVQAIVIKGSLEKYKGHWESIFLTSSDKSAAYSMSILKDIKTMSQAALKTQWGGLVKQELWGPTVGSWWAYEMVKTLDKSTIGNDMNIVRMRSDFERVMVNAILKSVERMSRDLAQMRGSLEDKMDPRVVDARLKTTKPSHYWSNEHQWGPDWPIPPTDEELKIAAALAAAAASNQMALAAAAAPPGTNTAGNTP